MSTKTLKLKGELHPELQNIGLKPGDEFQQFSGPLKNGSVHFTCHHLHVPQNCSVWPDNYEITETN